jgi:hypothetical protein
VEKLSGADLSDDAQAGWCIGGAHGESIANGSG